MITTEPTEFTEEKYPHSEVTNKILKCAVEVHKTLGPGFLEGIYERALINELKRAGLKVQDQVLIRVAYKGDIIGEHRLDLLVEDTVIIENKTAENFNNIHKAQVISYLKATGKKIGLLINFAKPKIEVKRIIL